MTESEGLRRRGTKAEEASDASTGDDKDHDASTSTSTTSEGSEDASKKMPAPEKVERPPLQHRIANAVLQRAGPLGVVLFLAGLIWVGLFPLVCITTGELKCRGTYFSENALSPGLGDISSSAVSTRTMRELEDEVFAAALKAGDRGRTEILAQSLESLGLEDVHVEGNSHVSAVLRPHTGADRRDAIIIVAQGHLSQKVDAEAGTQGCTSVGIVLGLAQALVEAEWLSKNVVFLFARDRKAVRAWTAAYHQGIHDSKSQVQVAHAGILVGGLVLDADRAPSGYFAESIDVRVPGANGLLPNLDLVNVVVHLLRAHGGSKATEVMHFTSRSTAYWDNVLKDFVRTLGSQVQALAPGAVDAFALNQYTSRMGKLERFMQSVAFGPTGLHAELLPFDIHALTLSTVYTKDPSRRWAAPEDACRVMRQTAEHTIRSLSNLEEKFHQSYFLYVLPDVGLFVSIGEYSGSLVLVLAPLLLYFLRSIVGPQGREPGHSSESALQGFDPVSAIVGACAVLLTAGCFGGFLLSNDAIGLRGLHHVFLTGPVSFLFLLVIRRRVEAGCPGVLWKSVKAALALALVVAHAMVGMVNYPLALISACWTSLFYAHVRPARSLFSGLCFFTWWIFVSPALAAYALPGLVVDREAWGFSRESSTMSSFAENLEALASAYAQYGVMHVPLLLLVHMPAHLVSLAILTGVLGRAE
ncbi:Glycosylphosphatidylinositol anchor attachment 1 protein [Hondaea fermentalgiana]|uniref:Glycosylphosphatidylinositol anchor attachment 1 protein n=1 Tax=Hondaea fermentalgiana TaxID=2315210 RepID=A0A2R5GMT4_9STRA|nr:Glycosylphosphatidylinositol anchor attachment 1 protein [Hondaea fermentalgiana]|eukprot:GBG31609.1 Glycosylphosphatidylinositol anchor attachment 1 protein [Hondaea fermentalgiana]